METRALLERATPQLGEMPESWGGSGARNYKSKSRRKSVPVLERKVIAWDMEGMSHDGKDKPQHAVIFGSSAAPPLVAYDLTSMEMFEHIFRVDREFPKALHVGYGWRYDATMLIKDFPTSRLKTVWRLNKVRWVDGKWNYRLRWLPGKWITISRKPRWTDSKRHSYDTGKAQSVTIYDYSSFFGGSAFLKVCQEILRDELTPADEEVIRRGKQQRGQAGWEELDEVAHYFSVEIQLIRRVMEKFRDVMAQAGFALKEWYGPGALANYIIAARKLRPHLEAAQTVLWRGREPVQNEAFPREVHEAVKRAFAGGRFEQFQLGRVEGPIHVWDINSAYPFALTMLPSLALDAGVWRHETNPKTIARFGVYRIEWHAPRAQPIEYRPMPLFMRNQLGLITFPQVVSGWYMSPEARLVLGQAGARIVEGWVWEHNEQEYPFEFLAEMYDRRRKLGKDNLLSLPFKLGPNSLYGKLAQTVGWNQEHKAPPKSHALAFAAWVTSYCRAAIFSGISQAPSEIIAVETDSIVTTADLRLNEGSELGQWSRKEYDEIVYVQSGIYHARLGNEWVTTKTRGLDRADVEVEQVRKWLDGLVDDWQPLTVLTRPRFIGLGIALATMRTDESRPGNLATWKPQERQISAGTKGKRIHAGPFCPKCQEGISPAEQAHPMFIAPVKDGLTESQPRRLPWEDKLPAEVLAIREAKRREMADAWVS